MAKRITCCILTIILVFALMPCAFASGVPESVLLAADSGSQATT